jgi:hypothetical protein
VSEIEDFLEDWDKDEGYRDKIKANGHWIHGFKKSKLVEKEDQLVRTAELLYDKDMWGVIHESKRVQTEVEKDNLVMVPKEEWRRVTRIVWLLTGFFTIFSGLIAASFFELL